MWTQSGNAVIDFGDAPTDADVKMKSVGGSMVSINDIKGDKGTLIIFTCNHCPFVIAWQDQMVELGNAYGKKGIGVVFINSNDPSVKGDSFEGMQELAQKEGYQFPYVVDETSDIARNFGAKKTPDVFLFDAAGKLVYHGAVGEGGRKPKPDGESYLKNALDSVLEGKAVTTPETKAVGCSIKFR
jgi:thiol-disulfide isomerase/thioredoxin